MAEPVGEGGAGDFLIPGQIVEDSSGQPYRVMSVNLGGGMVIRLAPLGANGMPLVPRSQYLSPAGTWKTELGTIVTTDISGAIGQSRTIPWDEWAGGGGSAGSAPAYSGTQAAQSAQFAHDQAMANLQAQLAEAASVGDYSRQRELQLEILGLQQDFEETQSQLSRDFQAEQQAKSEEAALKQSRLGVLQNLVEGFLASQQRATEFLHSLQPDAFRFAAAAQGMPVMGTTPQGGYAQALTEFAGRPAPSMDPNAPLSAIEGGIESIMGQQFPLQPGLFGGMSGGGTVPMGASGTFLVGEKGPEVMDVSPVGVTVRPLSGGFAYGGGVDFDPSSILAGLAPLYASLGLGAVPTAGIGGQTARQPGGWLDFAGRLGPTGMGSGKELMDVLGVAPTFVRNRATGGVYYIDKSSGEPTLRNVPTTKQFEDWFGEGAWGNVVNLSPSVLRQYGRYSSDLTEAPTFAPEPAGPFTTAFPMRQPTTGAILPAPYKVAAELRRLGAVNPDLSNIATGAYNFLGGLPAGTLQTAQDIFTPRGTYRSPLGLR